MINNVKTIISRQVFAFKDEQTLFCKTLTEVTNAKDGQCWPYCLPFQLIQPLLF